MSNKKDAASLLKRYLIARIPLIVLKTIETARALDMIRDVSLELVQEGWLDEKSFYAHTMSKGVYNLFTNQAVGNTGSSVLSAMDFTVKLLRQDQKLNQTMVSAEKTGIHSVYWTLYPWRRKCMVPSLSFTTTPYGIPCSGMVLSLRWICRMKKRCMPLSRDSWMETGVRLLLSGMILM